MISPLVMWKQYCFPSVVKLGGDEEMLHNMLSSFVQHGKNAMGKLSAHKDSVLLFTIKRLPMPMVLESNRDWNWRLVDVTGDA